MAQEILTPTQLQTNLDFRDFNGDPLPVVLSELSDGNHETGIKNFVSPAEITFKMSNPRSFDTFDTAIFQYQVEELGGGTKGTITTTLNGLQISGGSFQGSAGNGDIKEVDISNLSMHQIINGEFGFIIDVADSKISEVKIILTIIGGLVKLTQGQVEFKGGKISI